jgi:hypothetical protein
MAPSLEQEVNLSRRACRELIKLQNRCSEKCIKINLLGAKSSVEQDDVNCLNKSGENCAKYLTNGGNEREKTSSFYNKSQFKTKKIKSKTKTSSSNPYYLNRIGMNLYSMINCNKLLIFLVLTNVLLNNNCGYVTARPNAVDTSEIVSIFF